MITNLLNKTVKFKLNGQETIAKICAIFGANGNGFTLALVSEDGQIHCPIFPTHVKLYDASNFKVLMYHTINRKMLAIKVVRQITAMPLKEAKDFIEAGMPSTLKSNITYKEAKQIKNIVEAEGFEARIFDESGSHIN